MANKANGNKMGIKKIHLSSKKPNKGKTLFLLINKIDNIIKNIKYKKNKKIEFNDFNKQDP